MKQYGLYLLDLDGTIYRGRQVIPHAGSVVTELLRRGAQVRYFTNNSAARPAQVSAVLNHMGVPAKSDWVFGTAQVAASFCIERGYKEVTVIGEEGLKQTLSDFNITLVDSSPEAVIVGICRSLTYDMIDHAASLIRGGADFIATNLDATYPLEGGRLQPGAGAVVAAIQVASGRQPEVLGKPRPHLATLAMNSACVPPEETLVVGDRIDTDIDCGRSAGCDTFLVLTGVESALPPDLSGGQDLRGLL